MPVTPTTPCPLPSSNSAGSTGASAAREPSPKTKSAKLSKATMPCPLDECFLAQGHLPVLLDRGVRTGNSWPLTFSFHSELLPCRFLSITFLLFPDQEIVIPRRRQFHR